MSGHCGQVFYQGDIVENCWKGGKEPPSEHFLPEQDAVSVSDLDPEITHSDPAVSLALLLCTFLANPAKPLCLAGYPTVPRQRGLWGTECCPFFCSICRPQSGRAGNETMAFFLQDFGKVGIPTLLPIATKRAQKLATSGPG